MTLYGIQPIVRQSPNQTFENRTFAIILSSQIRL